MADTEIIFAVEESPEGGYSARALGYSIHTQAETLEELKSMLQDAVRCHFDDGDRPSVIRLHWVKDEVIPACGSRGTSAGLSWLISFADSATKPLAKLAAIFA